VRRRNWAVGLEASNSTPQAVVVACEHEAEELVFDGTLAVVEGTAFFECYVAFAEGPSGVRCVGWCRRRR